MARCPVEQLDDLADVFADLRRWDGVVEKSPGVFYARRQPFLHFHLAAAGERRADVKGRDGWHPVALPRPLRASTRRALLRELRTRYAERSPGSHPPLTPGEPGPGARGAGRRRGPAARRKA